MTALLMTSFFCICTLFHAASTDIHVKHLPCPSPCDNRVLYNNGSMTYVGGKNYLLVINRRSQNYTKVVIPVDPSVEEMCNRYQTQNCYNYMKIIEPLDGDILLLCSTHAGQPQCYHFNTQTLVVNKTVMSEMSWLKNDPDAPTVAAIRRQPSGNELYIGTCSSTDCIISRQLAFPLTSMQDKNGWMRGANLMSNHIPPSDDDKVYYFFRQKSTSFVLDQFVDGTTERSYGMVARVCQADRGGSFSARHKWMTFIKARLVCPYPGGSPMEGHNIYYDYMRATLPIGNVVHVLFTFPSSWNISHSALCSYNLKDIDVIMDGIAFHLNKTKYYDPVAPGYERSYMGNVAFLPGQCPKPDQFTTSVDSLYEAFVSGGSLVRKFVQPISGKPLQVFPTTFKHLTGAIIDQHYVLYFLGENELLHKILLPSNGFNNITHLAKIKIANVSSPVQSFSMVKESLILLLQRSVLRLPLANCSSYKSCAACGLDPHCSWTGNPTFSCVLEPQPERYSIRGCAHPPDPPSSLHVDATRFPINMSWRKASSSSLSYHVSVERMHDQLLVYNNQTSATSIKLDSGTLSAGWRYKAVVRVVSDETRSESVTDMFAVALRSPQLEIVEVGSSGALLMWDHVPSADYYNVTLTRGDGPSVVLVASYSLKYVGAAELSLPFHHLDQNQRYSVSVQAVSSDKVNSLVAYESFVTGSATTTNGAASLTTLAGAASSTTLVGVGSTSSIILTADTSYEPTSRIAVTGTASLTTITGSSTTTQGAASLTTLAGAASSTTLVGVGSASSIILTEPLEVASSTMTTVLIMMIGLLLVAIAIIAQNYYSFGTQTSRLHGDDNNLQFQRRCFCLWIPKAADSGQSGRRLKESSSAARDVESVTDKL